MVDDLFKRRAIYFNAFDIYGGSSGLYEYGPIGVRIRENIKKVWRHYFIDYLDSLEIDGSDIAPRIVFEASEHIELFNDPIVICSSCKTPYRADKLLEEYFERNNKKLEADSIKKLNDKEIERLIIENDIRCERCNGKLGNVERFNLMFKTNLGYNGEAYLRPETAQNIFVDFIYLKKSIGFDLPRAIGQIGRAYRNEISPRQELVRMRSFTQMELELFFDPESDQSKFRDKDLSFIYSYQIPFKRVGETEPKIYSLKELLDYKSIPNIYFAFMLYLIDRFLKDIGISNNYRFREVEKEELAHYSGGTVDLEIKTSYGYIECEGTAYRRDFDLKRHSEFSKEDLSVSDGKGRKFIPHVIEPSFGLDRLLFALLENSLVDDGRGWKYLKLNDKIAPYKYVVFPLQKDDRLIEKAKQLYEALFNKDIAVAYSQTGSIGKRYAKFDEIGVPYAITIDYQTLEDNTVTIRDRDTTKQRRVSIEELISKP
ncbi:MAG: proline--tRNA ligase [Candidatus Micrarchaeota archaeon]|nr:MAG: proline--tRNA ligase [Candidatus Micrarchaeota archaeon]